MPVSEAQNGTVTRDGATLKYVPKANFNGREVIEYTVSDGNETDKAQLVVNVKPVNDGPTAVDDTAVTPEDNEIDVDVLANDGDVDGNSLTIKQTTPAAHGTVEMRDNRIVYRPAVNFNGSDEFRYTVSDGEVDAEATVRIDVTPVNDAPTAKGDSASGDEDASVTVSVLSNDSDIDGATLTVTDVSDPANGKATISNGDVVYTPDTNFAGEDVFTYEVRDEGNLSSSASVTITVRAINDAPIANDDSAAGDEDATTTVNVLGNDVDPDDVTLKVEIVQAPTHGTATVNGDSAIAYTPEANFTGNDSLRYRVTDSAGLSSEASVLLMVNPVNDVPVAEDDSASVDEDNSVSISVLENDKDIDNDTLSVRSVEAPSQGAARIENNAIVYTPNANYHGADTFTYMVSDGIREDSATVSVTINAVNDVPDANDDNIEANEEEAKTFNVLGNDNDPDGDTLTISIESTPEHGTVSVGDGGELTYTPEADFSGADSFTYSATDGGGLRDVATVTINVNPTNDPPTAGDDSVNAKEDEAVTINVLENDADPDGDSLSVSIIEGPQHGNIVVNDDNTVTYTPAADYNNPSEPDGFVYNISDGQLNATAKVTVKVTPSNDKPKANDDEATTNEDEAVAINVLANDKDVDEDDLTVEVSQPPGNGSVTVNDDKTITYTPNDNFNGSDSFEYRISDGKQDDTAKVTITVNAVNDAPTAANDEAATDAGVSVTINVLDNDSDPDNDSLTIAIADGPANGAAQIVDNTVVYTPNAEFGGSETITYSVTDGISTTVATISISVVISGTNP